MVHGRMGRWLIGTLLVVVALGILPGCAKKVNYNAQLPPGQMALRKISPDKYPDFSFNSADLPDLAKSVDNSIAYMQAGSSRDFYPYEDITHDRALASLHAFRRLIDQAMSQAGSNQRLSFNGAIRQDFEVYQSIGAPDPDKADSYTGRVLFTGYFTPIYDGSLTKGGPYQWPLYKRPADLVVDPSGEKVLGRKTPTGQIVPYYTRAEIEGRNILAGQEFVYLKSRWDAYVITVQGSARLRLPEGRLYEIGYAGTNGYDYVSPGKRMLEDKAISSEQLTLKGLREYFTANPAAMDKYLSTNPRYVFFTERPGGPFGCLNVPVTTRATIATDKSIYPRAMPSFLQVPVPTDESGATQDYSGFMMDQDAGGAIRAAGRCDIFMGIGDQAERIAGHQLHEGKLYYIAIKPELVGSYLPQAANK